MNEIKFQKYKTKGANYHWRQVSKNILKRNIYVVAKYQLILDLIGKEIKGKKILDLGCGDGVLSYLFAKNGAEVIGIDSSEEAIKFAKEKCKDLKTIDFLSASVYDLPYEDRRFDYIVCSDVIEHLKYPLKMLSEIKRVCNSEGKIIITTDIKLSEKPLDKMHYREYSEEELRELLERYFGNVEIIKSHPLFWLKFQNKIILGHLFLKYFLNFLNIIFGFNPFLRAKGQIRYTLQIAVIKCEQ